MVAYVQQILLFKASREVDSYAPRLIISEYALVAQLTIALDCAVLKLSVEMSGVGDDCFRSLTVGVPPLGDLVLHRMVDGFPIKDVLEAPS